MTKLSDKVILFSIVFIIGGCTSSMNTYHHEQLAKIQKLDAITSNNGVSQEEAYLIAQSVFGNKISGCGFPLEPVSEGGYWVSKTAVGFGGNPGPLIFIDKFTGTAIWNMQTNSNIETKSLTLNDLKKLNMYVFTNSILKYMY